MAATRDIWIRETLGKDGNTNDLWIEYWIGLGGTPNNFTDMATEWLRGLGYTHDAANMWLAWERDNSIGV